MTQNNDPVARALLEAKEYWGTAHKYMRNEDLLYRNARALDLPDNIPGLRAVTLPIAYGIISRAQQNVPLSAFNAEGIAKPGLRGGEPTAASIKLAEKVGPWLNAAHDEDDNRAFKAFPPQQPPRLKAVTLLFLRGMVWLKTIEDITGYEPVKMRGESKATFDKRLKRWEADHNFPYPMYTIDPLLVFADPSGEYVFEESSRHISAIKRLFEAQGWDTSKLSSRNGIVTFRECWTEDYCAYYIGEELIEKREHNYGFIPYDAVFSGLGSLTEITDGSDDGPQNLAVGLIRYMDSMIEEVDYTTTEMGSQRKTNTYPGSYGPEGSSPPSLGAHTILRAGEQPPGWVNPPNQIPELSAYAAQLKGEIDQMTAPMVLGGQTPPRQTTATEYMGTLGAARLIIQNPMDALASGIEMSNQKRLRLLEMGGKKRSITASRYDKGSLSGDYKSKVQRSTLTGAELDGWYGNKVTIEPTNPQERALRINNARILYQDGRISGAEYDHEVGIKDTEAQQVRRKGEEILNSQPMVQAGAEAVAFAWRMRFATEMAHGKPGEADKIMTDMEAMLNQTPSGMNIPPQMEGQVPGSSAQAAQLIGQAGQPPNPMGGRT